MTAKKSRGRRKQMGQRGQKGVGSTEKGVVVSKFADVGCPTTHTDTQQNKKCDGKTFYTH